MKTLAAFILSLLTVSAFGQTYYVNTNTGVIATSYPTAFAVPGGYITGASLNDAAKIGWRQVQVWQTVSNGMTADSWTNSTATNVYPFATMLIASQHNNAAAVIAANAAQDAATTNSWDATFIYNAKLFRANLRAYTGPGGETNALVNDATMSQFLMQQAATNVTWLSPTNIANFLFMGRVGPSIAAQSPDGTTPGFFKRYGAFIP